MTRTLSSLWKPSRPWAWRYRHWLIDALKHSLDKHNKATRKTVKAVTDLVAALAEGVRGALPRVGK